MAPVPPSALSNASPELLEREGELAVLDGVLRAVIRTGQGSIVLLGGEAGVGKTSLLRRLSAQQTTPILWGSCDALFTPAPLGPLFEIADSIGGELAGMLATQPPLTMPSRR